MVDPNSRPGSTIIRNKWKMWTFLRNSQMHFDKMDQWIRGGNERGINSNLSTEIWVWASWYRRIISSGSTGVRIECIINFVATNYPNISWHFIVVYHGIKSASSDTSVKFLLLFWCLILSLLSLVKWLCYTFRYVFTSSHSIKCLRLLSTNWIIPLKRKRK